jgi:hypothetical protein
MHYHHSCILLVLISAVPLTPSLSPILLPVHLPVIPAYSVLIIQCLPYGCFQISSEQVPPLPAVLSSQAIPFALSAGNYRLRAVNPTPAAYSSGDNGSDITSSTPPALLQLAYMTSPTGADLFDRCYVYSLRQQMVVVLQHMIGIKMDCLSVLCAASQRTSTLAKIRFSLCCNDLHPLLVLAPTDQPFRQRLESSVDVAPTTNASRYQLRFIHQLSITVNSLDGSSPAPISGGYVVKINNVNSFTI